MKAGELPHRIEFQQKIETLNGNGQVDITWGPVFVLPGMAEKFSEQNATFNIRHNPAINAGTHRILRWGVYWTVNAVVHVHDSKDDRTTIQSDFTSLIEVTTLQSTTREYVDGPIVVRPPD